MYEVANFKSVVANRLQNIGTGPGRIVQCGGGGAHHTRLFLYYPKPNIYIYSVPPKARPAAALRFISEYLQLIPRKKKKNRKRTIGSIRVRVYSGSFQILSR